MSRQTQPEEMSFGAHLEVLRWHILRSLLAIALFSVLAFLGKRFLFDTVLWSPSSPDFLVNRWLCQLAEKTHSPGLCMEHLDIQLINITLSGQFMTHMYMSLLFGLVMAFPYVLWEIWRFVKPALSPEEKASSRGAVLIATLLFYAGALFSYFLIVPLTIHFLGTYEISSTVANTITLRSYINTVLSLSFAVGLVFELPVVVFFLARIGLLSPALMKKGRRVALVIILSVAALITPSDIFSMIMVAIPLYGLYEVSIGISKRVYARN
ncbi:MAG: twin-arginine translocase subunit TatC [Bacteroidetes bacterium]|nr:MAG: twin-arginine translocase subunit TatC [Bacteroidota bacterium]